MHYTPSLDYTLNISVNYALCQCYLPYLRLIRCHTVPHSQYIIQYLVFNPCSIQYFRHICNVDASDF